ncbi:hypothetical protein COOONC_14395 [Cooperia oncophora]
MHALLNQCDEDVRLGLGNEALGWVKQLLRAKKCFAAMVEDVSEESFAECKYDLSAQWVGECSRGLKYVTVSLRSLGIGPTQAAFYPNKTYFFTSFSTGTTSGIGDKMGGLCEMGVRLIVSFISLHIQN